MKHLKTLTLLLLLAIACTKEEEPYLNFGEGQNSALTLPASGASETISFTANNSWTATSSEAWLTINPASGEAGAQNVKITASANTDYDSRTATVTVKSQGLSQAVKVTQAENNGFVLSTTSFEIGSNGGTIKVPISANIDYTVEVADNCKSWLSVTQTKGLNNYMIELTAAKNDTYDERVGTAVIKSGEQEVTITVTQSQLEEMIVSITEFEIGSDGGEIKIPITTSIEYETEILENADWLTISTTQTKGLEEYYLVVSVLANEDYNNRVGQIKVIGSGKESVITVSQSQFDEMIVGTTEFEIGSDGGELNIPISTNVEYEYSVILGTDWISLQKAETKGLEETKISIQIAKNDGYDGRIGQIKIVGAGKESIVTIIQSQLDELIVGTTEFEIGKEGGEIKIPISTNIQYEAEVLANADWLEIVEVQSKGLEEYSLIISVSENTTHHVAKIGQIKISGAGKKSIVTITQARTFWAAFDKTTFEIGSIGGEIIVPFSTSCVESTAEVIGEASEWITIDTVLFDRYDTWIYLDIAENKNYDSRTGQIKIIIDGSELSPKITINQSQYDVVLVPSDTIIKDYTAGIIEIEFKTNIYYTINIPETAKSWLSIVKTKALQDDKITFSFALNDGVPRETVVPFINEAGDTTQTIKVIQHARDIEVNVEKKGGLESVLSEYDSYNIYSLKITGELNDEDFLFIRNMKSLRILDISEANISTFPDKVFDGTKIEEISLPKTLTMIKEKFFYGSNLKSIVIPANVDSIGIDAFSECTYLESVMFEANSKLRVINYQVFYNCISLKSIEIPACVECIKPGAFYGCSSLESVTFEIGSKLNSISSKNLNDGVPSASYYSSGTFEGCKALTLIEIPASVEEIGGSAFYGCTSLESVTFEIGSKLKTLGGSNSASFANCTSLKSIEIPASVETIAPSTFSGCTSLGLVIFETNSNLKTIEGGYSSPYSYSSYYYTYSGAFNNCKSLKSIVIPASVESIGQAVFRGCTSLESVTFESGSKLKTIRGGFQVSSASSNFVATGYFGAFANCTSLKSIEIPASVETIEATTFMNCESLELVTFEDNSNLKTIGGGYHFDSDINMGGEDVDGEREDNTDKILVYHFGAFANCTSLKSIEIPACVETIEACAFRSCTSLESVTFESGSNLREIGGEYCQKYVNSGGYYSKNYEYYFGAFSYCDSLNSITIPANVETIGDAAFRGCASLNTLSFEQNSKLKTIGERAFYNLPFTKFDMTECKMVENIGTEAFYRCFLLSVVKIGTATPPLCGNNAFKDIESYSLLKVPSGSEEAYKAATKWNVFTTISALDE